MKNKKSSKKSKSSKKESSVWLISFRYKVGKKSVKRSGPEIVKLWDFTKDGSGELTKEEKARWKKIIDL